MKKVEFKQIAHIYNGNSINAKIKAEKYSKKVDGWSYIGTKDVGFDGKVIYDNGVIIPFHEANFKIAPKDTTLVCSEGGSAGKKTAYIDRDICFGNKLYAIVNNEDKFCSKYIYYFTCGQDFFKQFKELMNGIIGGVSAKNFGKIEIPLPPLEEQEKIVQKIEELFSHLDKGIEEFKTVQAKLKVYRQAVLKEAFEGAEKLESLADVCEHITDGDHQAPPQARSGIPFIMISNIKKNKIDFSSTKFVLNEYYEQISNKRVPMRGDVLYSVVGSYGIPVLIDYDFKFCFQRHIALLRPKKIESKYLFYVLQTNDVYTQATNFATGTAQKTVSLGGLRKIKIPICKNQNKIVEEIEARLSICDCVEETIKENLIKAENLKQAILQKAFKGELV